MTIADILILRQYNQRLVGPLAKTPEEVVRWLGAVQSQDYIGAAWAVAQRTNSVTRADFDAAFAAGTILRTHVLRPTWHFVVPEDIRWMLELTAPTIKKASRYYWQKLELTDDIFNHANIIIEHALQGGAQLTRAELGARLEQAGIAISDGRLTNLAMHAELDAIICSGALRGKQHTYALLGERAPHATTLPKEEALAKLATRYFTSHGPATVQDFAWWSGLGLKDANLALAATKTQLTHAEVAGITYWFALSGIAAATPSIHLLANYDEYIVAYTDRTALFDLQHAAHLDSRQNPLFNNTIIQNGEIVGTWQAKTRGAQVSIVTKQFGESDLTKQLRAAAQQYSGFIGQPVHLD